MDGILGSWLWPGTVLDIVIALVVNEQMEDLSVAFSLFLG